MRNLHAHECIPVVTYHRMLTIWQDEAANILLLHYTPKLLQRDGEQRDGITYSPFPSL